LQLGTGAPCDGPAGPSGSIAFVEVIYDSRIIKVPGSTESATDKPGKLQASLSAKDITKLH
jgi:hypothetical protein